MKPEISIVMPVYNKCRYLKETVGSLLDQTYGDYELLLVDDGSTDGSDRLCDALSGQDPRIRTLHTQNRGVSAARNLGLRRAVGKYICFIDADDLVQETFLEKLHDAAETAGADLAVCGYYEMKYGVRTDRDLGQSGTGNEYYDLIRYNVLCVLWNKLFIRSRIRHFFREGLSTAEDSLFCVQYYLDNRPKIAYVYEDLYAYMRRGDGLTGAYRRGALYGIRELYRLNGKLLALISDEELKRLALHHVYKVFFYGVYTFVFENLCEGPPDRECLRRISGIIRNRKYREMVRYILCYPLYDRRAEATTKKEMLYILFSLLRMKRAVYALAKVKKCLDPYKNRL